MIETEHRRRIYVPPGHELKRTGAESAQRAGVDTQVSYFDVVDAAGVCIGSYVIRETQSTSPPFAASVTVEAVE
jgi:hypothetical protein